MVNRKIFFNEKLHKYTDDLGNEYVSTTTYIKDYYDDFTDKQVDIARACERIGRNPNHKKYKWYRGKTADQLLKEWNQATIDGCNDGNIEHSYLETQIKSISGYNRIADKFINDRIYTASDILSDDSIGYVDPDLLLTITLRETHPLIYNLIEGLVNLGYKLYAEIGVFNTNTLISGLIDLVAIKGLSFIIIDWKTNKAPIRFEAGYFEKDSDGNITDVFNYKDEFFKFPISHLQASTGNKYAMQLSTYAALMCGFGFVYNGCILCHIRNIDGEKVVEKLSMPNLITEANTLMDHFYSSRQLNKQAKIFM